MSDLVLPEHRPTAPDLLRPLAAVWRRAIVAGFAVLVAAIAAALLIVPDDGVDHVQRDPIEFNLRYPPELERVSPQEGELLRLERRRGRSFVDGFAVSTLPLPAYEGDVAGLLPIVAERVTQELRSRFTEFELIQEGKTRLNEVPGYTLVFGARIEGRRRLYGRVVLLPEPVAGARRGVQLLVLATPSAGVGRAEDAGVRGLTKRPYRTFRFGTEKP